MFDNCSLKDFFVKDFMFIVFRTVKLGLHCEARYSRKCRLSFPFVFNDYRYYETLSFSIEQPCSLFVCDALLITFHLRHITCQLKVLYFESRSVRHDVRNEPKCKAILICLNCPATWFT